MYVHEFVEASDGHWVSPSAPVHPIFSYKLFTEPDSARLADQKALGVHLSPPRQCWAFMHVRLHPDFYVGPGD